MILDLGPDPATGKRCCSPASRQAELSSLSGRPACRPLSELIECSEQESGLVVGSVRRPSAEARARVGGKGSGLANGLLATIARTTGPDAEAIAVVCPIRRS